MYESYYALEVMMRQRQRDILKEAELRRLARAGSNRRVPHRSIFAPVLARVGRFLVILGRRLETRAACASIAAPNGVCRDSISTGPLR